MIAAATPWGKSASALLPLGQRGALLIAATDIPRRTTLIDVVQSGCADQAGWRLTEPLPPFDTSVWLSDILAIPPERA